MPEPIPAPRATAPAPADAPTDLWATVDRLHSWLESHSRNPPRETLLLRMLKLAEETGEVAQAVIGATGQNPRKGTTHTWDDVESELCDVVITALVALRTLTPAPEQALASRLRAVEQRSVPGRDPESAPSRNPESAPGRNPEASTQFTD
ncbi:MazG-like family protein [Streptomyces lasiicapitis]|uniref:MazG-like family protein n=1 Tax=Streptomyces lasiicapitis TaxID=1923961 RepID=UPI0036C78403